MKEFYASILVAIFIIGSTLITSESSGGEWKPNKGKDLQIVATKLSTPPKIDGRLDENAWKEAARAGNFAEIQPGDNVQPEVQTDVLLGYDQGNLYVGFICYESDISKIKATLTNRDEFANDDFAAILIDTYGDLQRAYEFFVNPYGVQYDGYQIAGRGEDLSFDIDWRSAAKILGDKWEAEIAIPFKSIRFPRKEKQHWRIHFMRVRPRKSKEMYSWAPISRDNPATLAQAGHLWINERISTRKDIEFLPYIIGAQTGNLTNFNDPTSLCNDKGTGTIGLSVKYGISSDLTLDLALNPDYSQIESDVTQIDVNTTFALLYPEKRPFFLEGKDIFETLIDAIYTRSINDPLFATKLTGKVGRTSIGCIMARDKHTPWVVPFEEYSFTFSSNRRSLSNILRVKQDMLEDSYIGGLVTDRELSESFNRVIGVDGNIKFRKIYNFSFQILGSWAKEPNDTTLFAGSPDITFGRHTSAFDGEDFTGTACDLNLVVGQDTGNLTLGVKTIRLDSGQIMALLGGIATEALDSGQAMRFDPING